MPGYNHYPNCTCGWCVNYGGYSINRRLLRSGLQADFMIGDARQLLKDNHIRNCVTACFVNPNARCPVCGVSVFYYQNSAGSRVYFDDLGPPWPKHPCTDNRQDRSGEQNIISEKPSPRKRGISMELVEAASIAGNYRGRYFRPDGQTEHWTPIEVVALDRGGQTISIVARYLESDEREEFGFRFVSSETNLAPGDIIMLKGTQISLYDTEKMRDYVHQIEHLHQ